MTPEDARHGTNAGYVAHCFDGDPACQPCRDAHATYKRRRRTRVYLARGPLLIDSTGTLRRLQALLALGWTFEELDADLGRARGHCSYWVKKMTDGAKVNRTQAARVVKLYDRLSMRLPPEDGRYRDRTRKLAKSRGWLVPLAWDDERIDDPTYRPRLRDVRVDYDEVVVQRLMAGERLPSTTAEKAEVVRRWRKSGQSLGELERRTGINPDRKYGEAS